MTRTYAILSAFLISIISLIWLSFVWIQENKLKKIVIYFVSFSAGALLGDVFFHLLPEMIDWGFDITISIYILLGILFGLISEKIICRNHCHMPITKHHVHNFAIMNLVGDFIHNIIDGLIIWASYLLSIPAWIATTVAVLLHEIPQEIGDFWVLIHWWFSKKKALIVNLLTGLSSIIWVIIALLLWNFSLNPIKFLIPFAAGSFIYIACTDLIPELHKKSKLSQSLLQILFFILGISIMSLLLIIE